MKEKITNTDINAINYNDSNYLNNKGAKYYADEDYEKAVEYYHLAAALGNAKAISNLGYCYLYGRSVEQNTSLAIAYFEIAANKAEADACYKLGDIYSSDKWHLEDKERAIYYYRLAASILIDDEWEFEYAIIGNDKLLQYPSLCFALGRELMPNGVLATNIDQAYQFLKQADAGYEKELMNGANYYKDCLESVEQYLDDEIFDNIRDKYDEEFDDFDEDDIDVWN